MSLRHRIDRLALRRGGRSWIEPAGEQDGLPMQAHVYEHPNGQRSALIVPAPMTLDEWTMHYARKPRGRTKVEQPK